MSREKPNTGKPIYVNERCVLMSFHPSTRKEVRNLGNFKFSSKNRFTELLCRAKRCKKANFVNDMAIKTISEERQT